MWHLLCAIAHRLHTPVKKNNNNNNNKKNKTKNSMNYFVINLWLQEWNFQWHVTSVRGHIFLWKHVCFNSKKTTSKSWGRLYLGVQQPFVKTIKTTVVIEHYGRNFSPLNNGLKFHARRGWVFVLRVLGCNEEYWFFFSSQKKPK